MQKIETSVCSAAVLGLDEVELHIIIMLLSKQFYSVGGLRFYEDGL